MQKYWTPFRELESFSENLSNPPKPATGSEMNRFRSNHTESISSEMKWIAEAVSVKNVILNKILNTKPQVRTLTTNAKNLMESNKGTSSHGNKQHGFVTAVAYDNNLQPNRKRPSLEAIEEGPARKKNQSSNDNSVEKNVQTKSANGQDETKKNLKAKNPTPSKLVDQRCLTGDVAQVLKLNKSFPNVNAFYEVYAKVLKADSTKERKKTLLLRNNFGPVLQGVFYEIDFKMVDVKAGDSVRCVGKFVNNSHLHIFKISIDVENTKQLVPRLFSLANFVLASNETANHSKVSVKRLQ